MSGIIEPIRLNEEQAYEYRITALRECPLPDALILGDNPAQAAAYWKLHVATSPFYNLDCECLVVLFLNVRKRIKGHQLVSLGGLSSVLIHPREVYRLAVMMAADAIILAHNHPSGDNTPSDADIQATRQIRDAGKVLGIPLVDHIIMAGETHYSMRAAGYINDFEY